MTTVTSDTLTVRRGLRPGVHSTVTPDGELRLYGPGTTTSLGPEAEWKHVVLRRLAAGDDIGADPGADTAAAGDVSRADADDLCRHLDSRGWLTRQVSWSARPTYTVRPVFEVRPSPGPLPGVHSDTVLVLSSFATLHAEKGRFVVTSPIAGAEIEIHDAALLPLLEALTRGVRPGESSGAVSTEITGCALRDLWGAGLVVDAETSETSGAATDPQLDQWKPHDLAMHVRSHFRERTQPDEGFGLTGWRKGTPPLPAVRPPYRGSVIDLARPDLDRLRKDDPPLTAVIEDRESVRHFDDEHPMTLEQLGELLYRSAGQRGPIWSYDQTDYVDRPYPSGGAAYELELYPVVRTIAGLSAGFYHYDSHGHRLEQVGGVSDGVRRLLVAAARCTAVGQPPQVLLVVSARFGRVMRTYEQIPYALILKNVGVLYHNLYLVATAMGLAPCAVGVGDSAAFADVTGLGLATESSVGQFALGSRLRSGG